MLADDSQDADSDSDTTPVPVLWYELKEDGDLRPVVKGMEREAVDGNAVKILRPDHEFWRDRFYDIEVGDEYPFEYGTNGYHIAMP